LQPRSVADNVYLLQGELEHFSFRNGGNIVNTGFIVADEGVIVIDTGPSRLYGEALREAIGDVTDLPVAAALITHFHPDHFLGNQAFDDVPVLALPATVEGIKAQGELFNDAMYRMVGPWMKGTEVRVPQPLESGQRISLAGRDLELIGLGGHSGSDLAIFDPQSGVLFAGDLVFHGRTPTTPQADLPRWLDDLAQLRGVPYRVLVPGHGPAVSDASAIEQTIVYLDWLATSLRGLAERGASMAEALEPDASGEQFFALAVFAAEYQRSVAHLYPAMEQAAIASGRVVQREP
ncbi:MAG: quinoprotein relay system zinc metallohydrolase 1, partial [Gammaproteobacteria bacterium]|nr:quinoprotein relay system zinc metallohydrolase 1 [Gammaproteobacteria bacterium]